MKKKMAKKVYKDSDVTLNCYLMILVIFLYRRGQEVVNQLFSKIFIFIII